MQGLLRNTRVNGVKLSLLLGPSVPRGASLRMLHERPRDWRRNFLKDQILPLGAAFALGSPIPIVPR